MQGTVEVKTLKIDNINHGLGSLNDSCRTNILRMCNSREEQECLLPNYIGAGPFWFQDAPELGQNWYPGENSTTEAVYEPRRNEKCIPTNRKYKIGAWVQNQRGSYKVLSFSSP